MASKSLQVNDDGFQPKVVFIKRKPNQGFGFTLRHFIAYPPETWNIPDMPQIKAMETVFIKEVHLDGPAYLAGLKTGDRLLTVNDEPIAGVPYSMIVSRIKQTPSILKLEVVSKECDVLQMYYTDIAHNPESNRNKFPLINYVPSRNNNSNYFNTIPRKTLSFPTTAINVIPSINLSTVAVAAKTTTKQHHHQQMTKFTNSNFNQDTRNKLRFNEKFTNLGTPNFNFSTLPSTTTTTFSSSTSCSNNSNNSCDFMARLRKSIEQKEEFLRAVAMPQNNPSSFFKTFKTSDNPKRIISTGDKANNFYALNSMGFSQNPKGEDDDLNDYHHHFYLDRNFQSIARNETGSRCLKSTGLISTGNETALKELELKTERGEEKAIALSQLPLSVPTIATETIKDVQNDEQNVKKDAKLNKTIERSSINLALCRIPPKIKTTNMMQNNKNSIKGETLPEEISSVGYKKSDIECMKPSDDCITLLENSKQFKYRTSTATLSSSDENKLMRRISYLRATNNEDGCFHDINSEFMNFEKKLKNCDKENECKSSNDLQSITTSSVKSQDITEPIILTSEPIIAADMEIKSSSIFGKRLTEYRSWRHVKVELKGDTLKIFTGRNTSKSDKNIIELNLKNYEISEDISSRRKYVFKLQSKQLNAQQIIVSTREELQQQQQSQQQQQQINKSDDSSSNNRSITSSVQFTEIYFKMENINEMKRWIELLKPRMISPKEDVISSLSENNGKQLAEPQKTAAISSVSTSEYPDEYNTIPSTTTTTTTTISVAKTTETKQQQNKQDNEIEISSSTSTCSPVVKTRKADKDLGSPKTKNWRDLFRKGGSSSGAGSGGGSSSGSSSGSSGGVQTGSACRTTGSIGVPLKLCPMSKDNEYVPYIVDVCTKIVETKGLNVVGIYRIPGNKAAISELKDQVNRNDFEWNNINNDIRWEDVNVVSSLLKLFIRSLPDALLPSQFYNNFIETDKCYKGEKKLKEIKYLLHQLPVYSYETLKHIICHLHKISKNCHINLMEPKNLAIIFGPSIIRSSNETLEIAVKDMKHQCCIVELLVSQYEYFFESGAFPQLLDDSPSSISNSITQQHQKEQQTLLLGNVQKIERKYKADDKDKDLSVASRFIPHLRRRSQSKRNTINSDTYSGESILSLECKKSNNDYGESSEHGSKEEGGSLEISVSLTDEDSSNSGSMSLTTITDTLDTKLRNLRSTSESQSDENDNSNKQQQQQQQRRNNCNLQSFQQIQKSHIQHQQQQPLVSHENIPFADDSPERSNQTSSFDKNPNTKNEITGTTSSNKQSSTINNNNITMTRDVLPKIQDYHLSISKNILSIPNKTNHCHYKDSSEISYSNNDNDNDIKRDLKSFSDSDSEVSTTSDPKESILISPLIFEQRYKKRIKNGSSNSNYHKLFRSASFNCRNYNSSNNTKFITNASVTSGITTNIINPGNICGIGGITSNLTKDEKTDMNLTKKRQIQNKQNRSIKRRHTVK